MLQRAKPGQLSQENYALLDHDLLTVGEDYQVRVRVKPVKPNNDGQFRGEWSDWSPVVSWRSEIGNLPVKPGEDAVKSPSGFSKMKIFFLKLRLHYVMTTVFSCFSSESDNMPLFLIGGILLVFIIISIIIYKVKKSSR